MDALASAFDPPWLLAVLLLCTRLTAVFLMTPLLQAIPVPATVRVLLVVGLAAALALPLSAAPLPLLAPGALFSALLREFTLGAVLGLGILLAFAGVALAARLLDVQIGFGIGQVLDPLTHRPQPVLSAFFSMLGALLFFLQDGHHALLRGLALSVERFPLGRPWPLHAAAGPLLQQGAGLFTLGFALAAPLVLLLLLVDFALAVLARQLPQMNLFVLGLPVKVLVGLLALALWVGGMGAPIQRVYAGILRAWVSLFNAMPAGGLR